MQALTRNSFTIQTGISIDAGTWEKINEAYAENEQSLEDFLYPFYSPQVFLVTSAMQARINTLEKKCREQSNIISIIREVLE
jgi:hypothetical protein